MKLSLPTQTDRPQPQEGRFTLSPPVAGRGLAPAGRTSRRAAARARLVALQRQVLLLIWLILFCVGSYFLVSNYIVATVVVQGRSMLPTLRDGDYYLLNRLTYHYRDPRRDELVVLRDPGHNDCAVKRIVGLPNETVRITGGEVFVNGQKRQEVFLASGTRTLCPLQGELEMKLGSDQYFVLGDNRPQSEDSRSYGPVPRRQILGMIAR